MKPINNNEIIFKFLTNALNDNYSDLNIRAFIILYYVYIRKEVLSIKEYAEILGTNKTLVFRLIDKLIAKRLVNKTYEVEDGRKVAILPIHKRDATIRHLFNL
ncbi:MAG: hypothetical protein [Bacteriophage sp.]|nr:MAG: hypothetical protein [Bacteriophage sp.]